MSFFGGKSKPKKVRPHWKAIAQAEEKQHGETRERLQQLRSVIRVYEAIHPALIPVGAGIMGYTPEQKMGPDNVPLPVPADEELPTSVEPEQTGGEEPC